MHRYQVLPTDHALPSSEIIALDPACILSIVERLDCKSADVNRDGSYAFSIRLGENGTWCIYQREPLPTAEIVPFRN